MTVRTPCLAAQRTGVHGEQMLADSGGQWTLHFAIHTCGPLGQPSAHLAALVACTSFNRLEWVGYTMTKSSVESCPPLPPLAWPSSDRAPAAATFSVVARSEKLNPSVKARIKGARKPLMLMRACRALKGSHTTKSKKCRLVQGL